MSKLTTELIELEAITIRLMNITAYLAVENARESFSNEIYKISQEESETAHRLNTLVKSLVDDLKIFEALEEKNRDSLSSAEYLQEVFSAIKDTQNTKNHI